MKSATGPTCVPGNNFKIQNLPGSLAVSRSTQSPLTSLGLRERRQATAENPALHIEAAVWKGASSSPASRLAPRSEFRVGSGAGAPSPLSLGGGGGGGDCIESKRARRAGAHENLIWGRERSGVPGVGREGRGRHPLCAEVLLAVRRRHEAPEVDLLPFDFRLARDGRLAGPVQLGQEGPFARHAGLRVCAYSV